MVRKAIERAQLSPGQDCIVHLVCQAYALLEANRRKSHDIIVRAVPRGIAHAEANCRLYLGLPASRPSCGSPAYTCLVRTEIASLVIKPSCPWGQPADRANRSLNRSCRTCHSVRFVIVIRVTILICNWMISGCPHGGGALVLGVNTKVPQKLFAGVWLSKFALFNSAVMV